MPTRSITHVAVLGLGTMGHGIAQTFAAAGCRVGCFDELPACRSTLHDRVRQNLNAFVHAGLLAAEAVPAILDRLILCDTEAAAVAGADFVTEAVWEDLTVKQEVLARLEDLVAETTILASNSSAFPISQSGARLRHPERAVVTHWFNPPHLVPAVEVVPGPCTSPATVQTAVELLQRIGKLAIRLNKELPGFLVNRVQIALMREVWDLLDQGVATVEDLDAAIRGSMGFRLAFQGPLEIYDFGGLDIQALTFRNLAPLLRSDAVIPDRIQQMLDADQLGFKTGQGFYAHPAGDERRARRDRLFLALTKLLDLHRP